MEGRRLDLSMQSRSCSESKLMDHGTAAPPWRTGGGGVDVGAACSQPIDDSPPGRHPPNGYFPLQCAATAFMITFTFLGLAPFTPLMQLASALFSRPSGGFPRGPYQIVEQQPATDTATGSLMAFSVMRFDPGQVLNETHQDESAWVLLGGSAELTAPGAGGIVKRTSLIDEAPTVLHVGPATPVMIKAGDDGAEFAVVRTPNDRQLDARLFQPNEIVPEYRGAGLVQGACLRNVRLVFDQKVRPGSNLVIGEVVNYPGRWSSYPPHHHDQPEIYHYRFSHPAGYGHAEVGDHVLKVRDGDTVLIPPRLDHAQVSAPGYGMYYLWLIRHLPGNPYTGFTFTEEHKWTLDPSQQGWTPQDPHHSRS